jgi:hypothetical protein
MATSFTAARHGFGFKNDFDDELIRLPDGTHAFTTHGRCGGMAFLALDHWHSHKPIPGGDAVPADDTPLARLIQRRLFDSFALNGLRYVIFSQMQLDRRWLLWPGAAQVTRTEEFPKLKASIDAGTPCALGLCQASSLAGLDKDHQVVCYGYVEGPDQSALLIYDNNFPKVEHRLTFATRYSGQGDMMIRHSGGSQWRAFFVEDYHPEDPPDGL